MVSTGPPPLWEGDSGSRMDEGKERCYDPTEKDTNEEQSRRGKDCVRNKCVE